MAYLDTHPLHRAFIANKLERLVDQIAQQGDELLQDAGLEIPSRTVSLVLLIGENGEISAAEVATKLKQPHQLVTQRADLLVKLAIIERRNDPNDSRRKILALTAKGKQQYDKLLIRLQEAVEAFTGLFEEIDTDLEVITTRAMQALKRSSLLKRIKSLP